MRKKYRKIILPHCSQVMTNCGWTNVFDLTPHSKLACIVGNQFIFSHAEVEIFDARNGFCGARTGLTSEWQNEQFPDVAIGAYESTRIISGRSFGWSACQNGTFEVNRALSIRRMVRIRADTLVTSNGFFTFVNERFLPVRTFPGDYFTFTTPGYPAYRIKVPGNLILTRLIEPSDIIKKKPVVHDKMRDRAQAPSGAWIGHGDPMAIYRLVANGINAAVQL